jgi:hypothetical protein
MCGKINKSAVRISHAGDGNALVVREAEEKAKENKRTRARQRADQL